MKWDGYWLLVMPYMIEAPNYNESNFFRGIFMKEKKTFYNLFLNLIHVLWLVDKVFEKFFMFCHHAFFSRGYFASWRAVCSHKITTEFSLFAGKKLKKREIVLVFPHQTHISAKGPLI